MNFKLVGLLSGIGLFALGFAAGQSREKAAVAAYLTPVPRAYVVFGPDLKLEGKILSGSVSCFKPRNKYVLAQTTVQTLKVAYENHIRPFPQYDINDLRETSSIWQSPGDETAKPWPPSKSTLSFNKSDLTILGFNPGSNDFIRVKTVVMQGDREPKFWKNPVTSTYFSDWMLCKAK